MTAGGEVDIREAHKLDALPQFHDTDVVDRMLPVLEAPPAGVNIEDWEPIEFDWTRDEGASASRTSCISWVAAR